MKILINDIKVSMPEYLLLNSSGNRESIQHDQTHTKNPNTLTMGSC